MDTHKAADLVKKHILNDRTALLIDSERINTPTSLVFRLTYDIGGSNRVVFLKTPNPSLEIEQSSVIAQKLKQEALLIRRLKSNFPATPELQIIPLAGFIEDINGLATWEIQGESLQTHITNDLKFLSSRDVSELSRPVEFAATWLHSFHGLELLEGPIDLHKEVYGYYLGRVEKLLTLKKSKINEKYAASLLDSISHWINEASSPPGTRTVLCHNDYSPHNIVVTEKGICVLDFSFSSPGLPAFDLACFWHKLEDLKWSPLLASRKLTSLQEHFMDAYGFSFNPARPDVKLGLVRLLLSKMLTLLHTPGDRPYRRLENHLRYTAYLEHLSRLQKS